jgi:hypothetical protein
VEEEWLLCGPEQVENGSTDETVHRAAILVRQKRVDRGRGRKLSLYEV